VASRVPPPGSALAVDPAGALWVVTGDTGILQRFNIK
jgi:hypothetical protein